MGDAYQDVITDEERAIQMGETPPEKETVETEDVKPEGTGTQEAEPPAQETEKPAEEATADETKTTPEALTEEERKDAEAKGFKAETDAKGRTYYVDSEGTKIPEKRFGQIYRESKEAEALRRENETLKEKQTLFKQLGADEFYKLYPEEAPQGYKPPEPKRATPVTTPENFNVLNLQVTGGEYDQMTLREVMQIDPDAGTAMLNEWKDQQQAEIRKQEENVFQTKQEQETEAFNFGMARAKELFGIENANELTPEHNRKIVLLGHEVLAWQNANNKRHLSWEDAYKLMRHDDLIREAREKATAEALKGLQKTGPQSIDTSNGGNVQPTGWEGIAGMTPAQFDKHIDSLSDAEMTKFLREAPASIKAKHPHMPWK